MNRSRSQMTRFVPSEQSGRRPISLNSWRPPEGQIIRMFVGRYSVRSASVTGAPLVLWCSSANCAFAPSRHVRARRQSDELHGCMNTNGVVDESLRNVAANNAADRTMNMAMTAFLSFILRLDLAIALKISGFRAIDAGRSKA